MASVKKFEDLRAWQAARDLHRCLRTLTSTPAFLDDRKLRWQARDSAESVMSNIAEGFNRYRPAEFAQFLSIAKGSCGETQSHLYAMLDAGLILKSDFDQAYNTAQCAMALISRLRSRLRVLDVVSRPRYSESQL